MKFLQILASIQTLTDFEKDKFFESIPIIRQNLDYFVIKFYSYFLQTKAGLLFHETSLDKQYKMFHSSLSLIINHLDNPDYVVEHIDKLNEIHVNYGVEKVHVEYFVSSFMKALKDIFSDKYSTYQSIWYKVITEIMDYFSKVFI